MSSSERSLYNDRANARLVEVRDKYKLIDVDIKGLPVDKASSFNLISTDGRARQSVLVLPHGPLETPAFMPVGTQGTMKGLTPKQLNNIGMDLILSNTYHLGTRPGVEVLDKSGGLHKFMGWDLNILTDSGGFQMVSLLKFATITEEGVRFRHPDTDEELMLTPEESLRIQNSIGSDIMMALDDVVNVLEAEDRPRMDEATHRTTRWVDRCIAAHKRPLDQSLFAIVQGGLDEDLRRRSIDDLKERRNGLGGYAIGGLAGGEAKSDFVRIVEYCARPEIDGGLPDDMPRYLMGVGNPLDIIIAVAYGVDMFDCVYPTRTARFGSAIVDSGAMRINAAVYQDDQRPLEQNCCCYTCKNYTRRDIKQMSKREPIQCILLTIHNLSYMHRLCERIRTAIRHKKYGEFVKEYIKCLYPPELKLTPPSWVINALEKLHIYLNDVYDLANWSSSDTKEQERARVATEQKNKRIESLNTAESCEQVTGPNKRLRNTETDTTKRRKT